MLFTTGRLSSRVRGLDPVHVDFVIAAALLAWFEVLAATATGERARWTGAVLGVAVALAVANRRRWTIQALLAVLVAMFAKRLLVGTQQLGGQGAGLIGMLLLFYAAGAYEGGRRAWLAFGLVNLFGIAVSFKGASFLSGLFAMVAFVWLPWLVGRATRSSTARERASREIAERLDAERELHVRAAALSERARLAREIHDVIAHSVSVMVIQAAGARTVMDREPARAEEALSSVERAGREALAEMRRLLGVLGDGRNLRALAPQPGLDDLPDLLSSARAAGLDTSMRVDGEPPVVSQGLSLCVYRVVQEALTNTLKHAGPTRAEVRVHWAQDALELDVKDSGGQRGEPVPGSSGHGLVGMRERVDMHGGRLDAGPSSDGGFVVHAQIPLVHGSGV